MLKASATLQSLVLLSKMRESTAYFDTLPRVKDTQSVIFRIGQLIYVGTQYRIMFDNRQIIFLLGELPPSLTRSKSQIFRHNDKFYRLYGYGENMYANSGKNFQLVECGECSSDTAMPIYELGDMQL